MARFARKKLNNRRCPQESTAWVKLKSSTDTEHPVENKMSRKKIVWNTTKSSKHNDVQDKSEVQDQHSANEVDNNSKPNQKSRKRKSIMNSDAQSWNGDAADDDKQPASYKRRKPMVTEDSAIYIDNVETQISRFEGFAVRKSDALRLKELKKKLIAENVPRDKLIATLKMERRRAEKSLARDRKKVCFKCRHSGHVLSACPQLSITNNSDVGTGICFKCGSTEHQHDRCKTTNEYKFATCFVCKEIGHISKQCPSNPRGLYPHGGGCKICGDVTHLKKDCLQLVKQKNDQFEITADIFDSRAPDALNEHHVVHRAKNITKKKKLLIIKMKG